MRQRVRRAMTKTIHKLDLLGLSLVMAVACALPASAGPLDGIQQASRLEFRNPGLILDTPGRTGACDVVRFTPDGDWLLSAGDDKVVRMWPFDGKRLSADAGRILRWNIYREGRGNIYTLALSPEAAHQYVAVAGNGVYGTGMVALLDRETATVVDVAVCPQPVRHADVWAVAFSPSGDQIAFGTGDGGVWLWDRKAERGHSVRLVGHPTGPDYNPVRLVAFPAEHTLLSLASDGRVLEWDVNQPGTAPTERTRFQHATHVRRVAFSADGKLIAGFGDVLGSGEGAGVSGVEIRALDGSWSRFIAAAHLTYPNCLAFDKAGTRLAIGNYTVSPAGGFYNISHGDIAIYDLSQDSPRLLRDMKLSEYPEAVAFHPDGTHLAVAGSDNFAVSVWDLSHPSAPITEVSGPGHCLYGAGLSSDGRYLGFRDQRGPTPPGPNEVGAGPWRVFDLKGRQFIDGADFKPTAARTEESGWRIVPDDKDAYVWYVAGPGEKRYKLPLATADDMPRCYTFLPARKGGSPRLVVGHYWGMSLFEVTATGPRLLRKFTGHQGPVTAVAPSADGTTLLTASRDQIIAAWSLADWPGQAELGATFSLDGDRLVVDAVAPGSPAWEANLTAGDEIVLLAFDGKLLLNRGAAAKLPRLESPKDIDTCLERLRQPIPGKEFVFVRKNAAGLSKCLTTVRQRPLWQFFPTRSGEWVLWRSRDYYYDTSPLGDSYIGWQLGGKRMQDTPAYYSAEQFRGHYNRPERVSPDVLKRLVAYQEQPDPTVFSEMEPPMIELAGCPPNGTDADFVVTLNAKARGNRENQQVDEVVLWINDYQYQRWTGPALTSATSERDGQFHVEVPIPALELRPGVNTLSLQCYNRARGRATVWKTVRYTGKATKAPKLLGLFVGVGDYSHAKTVLSPLGCARDASELLAAWKQTRHQDGGLHILEDAQATRAAILRELDRLATSARPADLVIVSLAGHGFSAESMAEELKRAGRTTVDQLPAGTFAFCTPTFDYLHPSSTCVTSNDLYARLVKIRGHKIILLDACHAGTATAYTDTGRVSLLRELTHDGPNVGPAVLAACRPDETALEHPTIGESTPATGLFAISVIRALGDDFDQADTNHDGRLTVEELADFSRKQVGHLVNELKEFEAVGAQAGTAREGTRSAGDDLRQHPEASIPERESHLVVATAEKTR